MVKSADDKLCPEIQDKNRDLKITIMEMYQTAGFFPPRVLQVP